MSGNKDDMGKMIANSKGRNNCFNCGKDNHWVVNCWGEGSTGPVAAARPYLAHLSLPLWSLVILVATKIHQTNRKEALSIDDYFKEVIYIDIYWCCSSTCFNL